MNRHRSILFLLLLGYVIITAAYSVVNPLFEAPDEYYHYFTVQYIADEGKLPIAQQPDTAIYVEQEAAQPPLYYWLGSWLIKPIDTSGSRDALWLNPRVQMGDASAATNINRVVHDRQAEAFPWSGYVLAGQVLRLFSLVFGLGTLLALYAAVRSIWPDEKERALFALALVAFLPQFNFLHSYINNDVAIIFFATLTLLLLVRVWNSAETIPTMPTLIKIGILVGLAMLSKTAGLLLLVYATGFIFVTGLIHGWRLIKSIYAATVVGLSALALAGWLLVRNWQLYGDISAANQFVAIAGGDEGFTLLEIFGQSSGIWRSLIAVFGWFNVVPPLWIYWVWSGIIVFALIGALLSFMRAKPRLLSLLLAGWIAIIYAGMVAFMLRTPAAQGRLLLPAILPLVLPVALGLAEWRKRVGRINLAVVAVLPLLSLFCLFFVIQPIYARPPVIDNIPSDSTSIETLLVDNLLLKSSKLWITPYLPGDNVKVDLYWESTDSIDMAHEIVVEIFGRNNQSIGKLQSFHGGGLYPTNLWSSQDSLASSIAVRLDTGIDVPTQARVNVRIVGEGDGVDIGFVEVEPEVWPTVADEAVPLAVIGDGIELISAEISQTEVKAGDRIDVNIIWHVTANPGRFFTTLLHLGPSDQAPLAQGDSAPLSGSYPTTLWETAEVIEDSYSIVIPEGMPLGQFPLRIGMYDEAIVRLPLFVEGQMPSDLTFTIETITVTD